jgi:predicted MFS family arabinose efflux permease
MVACTAGNVGVALMSLGLWFMCGGGFYSTQQTFLSSADPSQRASVVGWNNSMLHAGTAVGTAALGCVAVGSAPFAMITGAFGVAALTAAVLLVITNRRTAVAMPTTPGATDRRAGRGSAVR